MELLLAIRDLGVADPAVDTDAEAALRAVVHRQITAAGTVDPPPVGRTRRRRPRLPGRRLTLALSISSVAAAAGATIVLTTSDPAPTGRPAPVRVAGATPMATVVDASYVMRRVRARIATNERDGVVLASLNTVARPAQRDLVYFDPRTSVLYQDDQALGPGGRVLYDNYSVARPIRDHMHFTSMWIDYTQHTWSRGSSVSEVPLGTAPAHARPLPPGASSTPAMIRRALSAHLTRRVGRSTLDGAAVYVLAERAGEDHITLYVDARTFAPVREIERFGTARGAPQVTNVLAATRANLARVIHPPRVPAGYRRVG